MCIVERLKKGEMLFKKVELKEDVFPLDLRVAEIKKVEDHPNADKLYVLQVDIGETGGTSFPAFRQIVAGMKPYYKKEELIGKKIVVVKNLKPANLRGVESQGMLLAGQPFGKGPNPQNIVGVLTIKGKPGDQVAPEGLKADTKQITYEQFSKVDLNVKVGKAYFEDRLLKSGKEIVFVEKVKEGKVK